MIYYSYQTQNEKRAAMLKTTLLLMLSSALLPAEAAIVMEMK
ncbi:hypothetical protein ACM66Z_01115 [Sulfurovum sp. ST-21]